MKVLLQMLELDYKDVVMNSPFDSLRQLLRIQHPNKFAMARDFLATSGLSDDEVRYTYFFQKQD